MQFTTDEWPILPQQYQSPHPYTFHYHALLIPPCLPWAAAEMVRKDEAVPAITPAEGLGGGAKHISHPGVDPGFVHQPHLGRKTTALLAVGK
jgi:hypothetical protein